MAKGKREEGRGKREEGRGKSVTLDTIYPIMPKRAAGGNYFF
jgi:ribosomal protein S26